MSRFFSSPEMQKAESNFERALVKLQSEKPKIGEDTREEEDGRCFVFHMEVSKEEYEKFLDQYNEIMDKEIETFKEAA